MKKFIYSLVLFLGISVNVFAQDSIPDVKVYTQNLIDNAIVNIFNKNIETTSERVAPFSKILKENFDFEYISRFVLGPYGRGVTDAELKNFVDEFADLNVYTFVKKFDLYSDLKIEVTNVTKGKKEGQYFVDSKVLPQNAGDRDYMISWRIVKKNNSYKVIDVIVEGVSMAMSYKNEYSPILKDAKSDGENPVVVLTTKIEDKVIKLKLAE